MKKTISGTKEWAKKNVNCVKGCSNNCRYCYGSMATQYERCTDEDWPTETACDRVVTNKFRKSRAHPRAAWASCPRRLTT